MRKYFLLFCYNYNKHLTMIYRNRLVFFSYFNNVINYLFFGRGVYDTAGIFFVYQVWSCMCKTLFVHTIGQVLTSLNVFLCQLKPIKKKCERLFLPSAMPQIALRTTKKRVHIPPFEMLVNYRLLKMKIHLAPCFFLPTTLSLITVAVKMETLESSPEANEIN